MMFDIRVDVTKSMVMLVTITSGNVNEKARNKQMDGLNGVDGNWLD